MFGGTIIDAICESQISIGGEMAADANAISLVSNLQMELSKNWFGNKDESDALVNQMKASGKNIPEPNTNYTTSDVQAMLQYIAQAEVTPGSDGKPPSGEDLTRLEMARQAWSSRGSMMDNLKDLQKSPLDALAQAGSSNIQQDQSAVSGSSSLGNGMADLDGIAANLVSSINA